MLDQEHGLAAQLCGGADECHGVLVRIGMRQATRVLGDAAVVGEARDRLDVGERRLAQGQPLGGDDIGPRLAQMGARKVLQHVRLRQRLESKRKWGGRFPASLEPSIF